jgi:hypothetical protein
MSKARKKAKKKRKRKQASRIVETASHPSREKLRYPNAYAEVGV